MKSIGPLQSAYLSYFSTPAADRRLYRAILKRRVSRILAIGLADGQRGIRMIAAASRSHEPSQIHFAAIDQFEARSSNLSQLPLKRAHQLLKKSGAQIKLVPGDPYSALARTANTLADIDLVVISDLPDQESLERAWFYFPRMLHEGSLVLREVNDRFEQLSQAEIEQLARRSSKRLRAA